jgi:hypothetical protein
MYLYILHAVLLTFDNNTFDNSVTLLYRKNNVDEIYIKGNHALRCLT